MTARTPDQIRSIRGTARRDRPATPAACELLPRLKLPPPAPAWLVGRAALDEWDRASRALAGCGLLHEGSLTVLGHYAQLHQLMTDAYAQGEAPPAACFTAMRALASSLGLVMAPVARTPTAAKPSNPFAAFKRALPVQRD